MRTTGAEHAKHAPFQVKQHLGTGSGRQARAPLTPYVSFKRPCCGCSVIS